MSKILTLVALLFTSCAYCTTFDLSKEMDGLRKTLFRQSSTPIPAPFHGRYTLVQIVTADGVDLTHALLQKERAAQGLDISVELDISAGKISFQRITRVPGNPDCVFWDDHSEPRYLEGEVKSSSRKMYATNCPMNGGWNTTADLYFKIAQEGDGVRVIQPGQYEMKFRPIGKSQLERMLP